MKSRYRPWTLSLLLLGQMLLALPAFAAPVAPPSDPASRQLLASLFHDFAGGSCRSMAIPFPPDPPPPPAPGKCSANTGECASAGGCANQPPGIVCGHTASGADKFCTAHSDDSCCGCV